VARHPLQRPRERRLLSVRTLLCVALGGALGAVLRSLLTDALPDGTGFPWTTFTINVVGSLVLALLPALPAVRRRAGLALALGPGACGGFTTLSAYSEQTRALLDAGHAATAAAYCVGTLAACLFVVALASRLTTPRAEARFAAEGGEE
jgi:fluoride exporter